MGEYTVFTLSQVAHHKSKKDCWLVIHGRVLNVTKFLEEHPGGEEVLMEWAGKDGTQAFEDIGHSKSAQKLLLKYQVGVLQGYTFTKGSHVSIEEPKKIEMSAFVIKDDRMRLLPTTLGCCFLLGLQLQMHLNSPGVSR